jgi:hypothetical protein
MVVIVLGEGIGAAVIMAGPSAVSLSHLNVSGENKK